MSTTTPFRELPARAKAGLPAWELRKDKEEVTYKLKKCRGVMQNNIHEVSLLPVSTIADFSLYDVGLGYVAVVVVVDSCEERVRGRDGRRRVNE